MINLMWKVAAVGIAVLFFGCVIVGSVAKGRIMTRKEMVKIGHNISAEMEKVRKRK